MGNGQNKELRKRKSERKYLVNEVHKIIENNKENYVKKKKKD